MASDKTEEKKKKLDALKLVADSMGIKLTTRPDGAIQVDDDLSDDVYSLDRKRGCALIMSNSFKNSTSRKPRVKASAQDVKCMTRLWRDCVGCDLFVVDNNKKKRAIEGEQHVDEDRQRIRERLKLKNKDGAYENVYAKEMLELLRSLSETKEDYAYIVVVISTHGIMMRGSEIGRTVQTGNSSEDVPRQVFFGDDSIPVSEKDVMELFYNDKNIHLKGIPKFFILDYCRYDSEEADKGTEVEHEESEPISVLPLRSDFVIAYATHRSHLAFENKEGSWLIRAIADVFSDHYQGRDVVNMLTKVNAKVYDRAEQRRKKAMSVFESSLLKEFRLWIADKEEGPTEKAIPIVSQGHGEESSSVDSQPTETSETRKRKKEQPQQQASGTSGSSSPKRRK